jgi:hypothetical protein
VLHMHRKEVTCVSLFDGSSAVTGSSDGHIAIYDCTPTRVGKSSERLVIDYRQRRNTAKAKARERRIACERRIIEEKYRERNFEILVLNCDTHIKTVGRMSFSTDTAVGILTGSHFVAEADWLIPLRVVVDLAKDKEKEKTDKEIKSDKERERSLKETDSEIGSSSQSSASTSAPQQPATAFCLRLWNGDIDTNLRSYQQMLHTLFARVDAFIILHDFKTRQGTECMIRLLKEIDLCRRAVEGREVVYGESGIQLFPMAILCYRPKDPLSREEWEKVRKMERMFEQLKIYVWTSLEEQKAATESGGVHPVMAELLKKILGSPGASKTEGMKRGRRAGRQKNSCVVS